jgi:transcriptional regulator with XRE-family HTH domain
MSFAGLLRQLRVDAGLTQEELAEAASLSLRAVSDLERGVNRTARKDTARLLADALNLAGPARAAFEASARGRAVAAGSLATVVPAGGLAGATRTLPRDVVSFTGREADLRQLVASAAGPVGVVGICAVGGMAGIGKTTHGARYITKWPPVPLWRADCPIGCAIHGEPRSLGAVS